MNDASKNVDKLFVGATFQRQTEDVGKRRFNACVGKTRRVEDELVPADGEVEQELPEEATKRFVFDAVVPKRL